MIDPNEPQRTAPNDRRQTSERKQGGKLRRGMQREPLLEVLVERVANHLSNVGPIVHTLHRCLVIKQPAHV